jgi:hypothetical protein
MITTGKSGVSMKNDWKLQISKMTGNYPKIDKKLFRIKRSWDEVAGIINTGIKKKKK